MKNEARKEPASTDGVSLTGEPIHIARPQPQSRPWHPQDQQGDTDGEHAGIGAFTPHDNTPYMVSMSAQSVTKIVAFTEGCQSPRSARKLRQSRRVICASPAYPVGKGTPSLPSGLRDHDCLDLVFERPARAGPWLSGAKLSSDSPRGRFSSIMARRFTNWRWRAWDSRGLVGFM